MTKQQLKTVIQRSLESNPKARLKALVLIHRFQTEDEAVKGITSEHNGAGWNQVDAPLMTGLFIFYGRNGFLTERQDRILKAKIGKYWGQLVAFAMQKIELK